MVRSPGFEPGSSAWEADVLAKLDYDRCWSCPSALVSFELSNPLVFTLIVYYFEHWLATAFWRLLFTAVVGVCAVATLVVGFNFFAACFALERWHLVSQENTLKEHNKFAC